jgi:hypothetical protein
VWGAPVDPSALFKIRLFFAYCDRLFLVNGSLYDWIEKEAQTTECRKFAHMPDAALRTNFEYYRIACGMHQGRLPRAETMQNFWAVWCELRLREESEEQLD